MRKISTMKNRAAQSVTRGRVAMVTGGVVAAIALGSTAAFAAGAGSSAHTHPEGFMAGGATSSISVSMHQQATGQQAAADKAAVVAAKAKVAAAHAKAAAEHQKVVAAQQKAAAAAAVKRAQAKAAADHKALVASWETPTTGYVLGAGFNQAGPHWIHKHSGQDFVVNTGTTVRAAHTGTVVTAGWGGAYGNNIVIKHADHLYTQYGHLSHIGVNVGEQVITGEKIGLSGSTGNSTGPHLHFEVRTTPYYGSAVEPLHFLKDHGVRP
ncbi:M23 family metallopeptidase [Streptomyces sp. NBC_01190]|uniref:M23 family metallopeptidase n=1 Tax=Streptomyces sp. NBC_01190 TaxID=2903767 RepID=UPI00386D4C3B|nr:M23 family metallopeptidase [Streptomyces sp. NBC_01190]